MKHLMQAPEIRQSFNNMSAWIEFRAKYGEQFLNWKESVLQNVRQYGYTEPITKILRTPHSIHINQDDLRESISCGELNSRKRALIATIEHVLRLNDLWPKRNLRIIAPEAISRTALIFRGLFPYFYGAEYLPDEAQLKSFFPINHIDLNNINFPDNSFDMFFCGDVFEHLADLPTAYSEIVRITKPGGYMFATFPFNHNLYDTSTKATKHADGTVVYHETPEYHGNPVKPEEGSLVYAIPGWDILTQFSDLGCESRLSLVISSIHGITASASPGVFVLVARKNANGLLVNKSNKSTLYTGIRTERAIGLIGLPRSGTTVLAAVFAAHPDFDVVYEPWNSGEITGPQNIENFRNKYYGNRSRKNILIKETSKEYCFVNNLIGLVNDVSYPMSSDFIFILRNPIHTMLSEFEGRKKWWGEHDLVVDANLVSAWFEKSIQATANIVSKIRQINGVIIAYENLVDMPEKSISQLFDVLDIPQHPNIFDYHKHVDSTKVRGDVNVATQPRKIDSRSRELRNTEAHTVDSFIRSQPHRSWLDDINRISCVVQETGPIRIRELGKNIDLGAVLLAANERKK